MIDQEAREAVQLRLGALSLLIWFGCSLTLIVLFTTPFVSRAPQYLLIGSVSLAVAALPWLGYRRWVAAEARRREDRASGSTRGGGDAANSR